MLEPFKFSLYSVLASSIATTSQRLSSLSIQTPGIRPIRLHLSIRKLNTTKRTVKTQALLGAIKQPSTKQNLCVHMYHQKEAIREETKDDPDEISMDPMKLITKTTTLSFQSKKTDLCYCLKAHINIEVEKMKKKE